MERRLQAIAAVLSTLLATPTYAEECKTASPVKEPCEGVLVPADQARKALLCIKQDLPKCVVQLDTETKIRDIEIGMLRKTLAVEKSARISLEERIATMSPVIEKKETHPALYIALGGFGGLLVGAAAGIVYSSLR